MNCKTCGKANCYAHGGKVKGVHTALEKSDPGRSVAGSLIGGRGYREDTERAKEIHRDKIKENRKLPKPKLKGLAEGGEVDMYEMDPDVPAMHGYAKGGKISDKERMANVTKKQIDLAKANHKPMSAESKAETDAFNAKAEQMFRPTSKHKGYAEGGDVEVEMDMPDMEGDASGDDELNDMVAGELMDALERKDKQGVLDAIKALVLSAGSGE